MYGDDILDMAVEWVQGTTGIARRHLKRSLIDRASKVVCLERYDIIYGAKEAAVGLSCCTTSADPAHGLFSC